MDTFWLQGVYGAITLVVTAYSAHEEQVSERVQRHTYAAPNFTLPALVLQGLGLGGVLSARLWRGPSTIFQG